MKCVPQVRESTVNALMVTLAKLLFEHVDPFTVLAEFCEDVVRDLVADAVSRKVVLVKRSVHANCVNRPLALVG